MAEVNIDVALESSVQEVLSAVARETTSQKILEQCGGGNFLKDCLFIQHSAKTSSQTPVSITGKGKFYYGEIRHYIPTRDSKGTLKIIIDGVTMFSGTHTNTDDENANGQIVMLGNPSCAIGANSTLVYAIGGAALSSNTVTDAYELISKTSNVTKTTSSSGSQSHYYYIKDCIEFNQSFKITMTGCSTGSTSTCKICYSLDED